MSFSLASSEAIVRKAGANISSKAAASGALLAEFSNEAEAMCNLHTRYNWISNVASLNAQTSGALQEAAANLGAIQLIAYDMSAIGISESEDRINLLNYRAFRILDLLEKDVHRKFMIDGRTGAG